MGQDVHVFTPEEGFKVQAWFDVVTRKDGSFASFYPLFNVFNYSASAAEVVVGMQLLDQAGKVLVEATDTAVFEPTEQTEGSYETYLSIIAVPISVDVANQAKFLRVVFRR